MDVLQLNINGTAFKLRGTHKNSLTAEQAIKVAANMSNKEKEVFSFIDRIPPNDIFYDLGSCHGKYAIYAAIKGIKTYAIEPESVNFAIIQDNIKLNSVQNICFPIKKAVGSHNHKAIIKIGLPHGGAQRVVADAKGRSDLRFNFVAQEKIEVVPLDELVKGYEKPNHIKVDIDGSELEFIKGAKNTFASKELKKVIFEICTADKGSGDIIKFMKDNGFHEVERHHIERKLFNVIFLRQ